MIWKDRIIQYPHRYTLTNVSGTTYDFEAVTGEVNEVGTPVSAENMNKLLQRDGDDIKDTVTTFTEAGTRANIATGENTSTIFGKIKKWFTDLKPHAFTAPSTAQSTSSNTVPSDKLLTDSSFARIYVSFAELGLSASTATPVDVANAMVDFSKFEAQLTYAQAPNLVPNTGLAMSGRFTAQRVANATIEFSYSIKEANTTKELLYTGFVRTIDSSNQFSGWKQIFTTDNISTVMPLSSAAASNEKVYSEKLAFDEFANRTFMRVYRNLTEIDASYTGDTPIPTVYDKMVENSMAIYKLETIASAYPDIEGVCEIYKINEFRGFLRYTKKTWNSTTAIAMYFGSLLGAAGHAGRWSGWKQLATTDNPTFTGTVTVPAPTNPTDAARLQDVTGLSAVYDKVIRSQAEFEALLASPTWFDAVSVAFVGQFTLSTPDNSGVKRPANVTRIDGYNNAKITVTNFVYNSTTAKGGLWDDENTNNPRCYINDLTVDCTGTALGYGFRGNNNTYTNCTGSGTSGGAGNGFRGNNNTYTACTGTGTCTGTFEGAYGFYGDNNTYTACSGSGTGNGSGYGFRGHNNTYTACTGSGTGSGIDMGIGVGFMGSNNRIISCTALAYLPTDSTPSDTNCVPIYNDLSFANKFMIIRDCKFPQIAKTGYQQGTIWCNIANNTTMVGSIKDNVYHSRFTVAPIKGVNVVADNNSVCDITAI